MAYEFTRESSLYLVQGTSYLKLRVIPGYSFSQTFKQNTSKTKTLHSLTNLFEKAVTNEANPADFDFTIPILEDNDMNTVLDLLLEYDTSTNLLNTFDLYIETDNAYDGKDQYKLEGCVFTSGAFNIASSQFITLNLGGQAKKITILNGAFNTSGLSEVSQTSYSSLTRGIVKAFDVSINSTSLTNVYSVSLEVQNNISWAPGNTVHSALSATNASTSVYPSNYFLTTREVAGSIEQYVSHVSGNTTALDNRLTWQENVPVRIRAGRSSDSYQVDANLQNCSITNRLGAGALMTQSYEYKLTTNPANLKTFFTY